MSVKKQINHRSFENCYYFYCKFPHIMFYWFQVFYLKFFVCHVCFTLCHFPSIKFKNVKFTLISKYNIILSFHYYSFRNNFLAKINLFFWSYLWIAFYKQFYLIISLITFFQCSMNCIDVFLSVFSHNSVVSYEAFNSGFSLFF